MAIRKPLLSVQEARSLAAQHADPQCSVATLPVRPVVAQASQVRDFESQLAQSAAAGLVETVETLDQPRFEMPSAIPATEPASMDVAAPPLPSPEAPVALAGPSDGDESSVGDAASVGVKSRAGKVAAKPDRKDQSSPKSQALPLLRAKETAEPRVQVFLSAALPSQGVSKSYELLCRQYTHGKALQMILRRALDDYEVLLDKGELDALPEVYPEDSTVTSSGVVHTSRIMPIRLVEKARSHFDPLGFESDRAFGRKLASAALAIFFEIQAQHH